MKNVSLFLFNEDYDINANTESSLHWGNKYEPASILINEAINSTKITSLGCMTHSTKKYVTMVLI